MIRALTVWMSLLILACGPKGPRPESDLGPRSKASYVVRARGVRQLLVKAHPELDAMTNDVDIALALREIAYFSIRSDGAPTDAFYYPTANIQQSVLDHDVGYLCQGIAITYQQMLAAFQIPSRYVGMFKAPMTSDGSHASTEVFLNGKWILYDATFNFSILNAAGVELSATEFHDLVIAGQPYTYRIGPSGSRVDRDINTYPDSLASLSTYTVIFPGPGETDTVFLPNTWNGSYSINGFVNTVDYDDDDIYAYINASYLLRNVTL